MALLMAPYWQENTGRPRLVNITLLGLSAISPDVIWMFLHSEPHLHCRRSALYARRGVLDGGTFEYSLMS